MPLILDGKALAQRVRAEVAQDVVELKRQGVRPRLHVALVGDFAPSQVYVRSKEKACAEAGIETETARLPESTTRQELLAVVADWNRDAAVHGILVQLPLPGQIDEAAITFAVDPRKDVDGLHPVNLGRILSGTPFFYPATPSGILEILSSNGIMVNGKHVVVVGRGNLVGKPLTNMLLRKPGRPCGTARTYATDVLGNATVTVCHTGTPNMTDFTRQADILIAAAGKAGLVQADMVKPGAVVIDVGTNRVVTEAGPKLVGDVDFAGVAPLCSAITPVPGGVGPMTVAMLLVNTVRAAKRTLP